MIYVELKIPHQHIQRASPLNIWLYVNFSINKAWFEFETFSVSFRRELGHNQPILLLVSVFFHLILLHLCMEGRFPADKETRVTVIWHTERSDQEQSWTEASGAKEEQERNVQSWQWVAQR